MEPSGIPVGETADEPDVMPSGEVALRGGVVSSIPPTCAMATLETTSAGSTAAISQILIGILPFEGRVAAARRYRRSGEFVKHAGWLEAEFVLQNFSLVP